jgi:DNA invertase Pin-like site-specific DNA recombinase
MRYINSVKQKGDKIIEFDEPDTTSRLPLDERPVITEMLEELRSGDTLVIYKLNRLARKGTELANLYEHLCARKVKVYSLKESYIDKNIIHIYAMLGEMERDNISMTTTSGLARKRSKMERVGAIWYGYQLDEKELSPYKNAKSEGKPYKLIPHPEEQRVLELMKALEAEGHSYDEITAELERQDCKNRKGNPFQKTSVWRILQREKMVNPSPTEKLFSMC